MEKEKTKKVDSIKADLDKFYTDLKNGKSFIKAFVEASGPLTKYILSNENQNPKNKENQKTLKTSKKRVVYDTGWDSGRGKRGQGKKWNVLNEAWEILFNAKNLIKKYGVKMDSASLTKLLRDVFHELIILEKPAEKILPLQLVAKDHSEKGLKLVKYCLITFFKVIEMFHSSFGSTSNTKTKIVTTMLSKYYPSYYVEMKTKGKKFTTVSIGRHVKYFRKKYQKKKPFKSIDVIAYLCFIYCCIYVSLDIGLLQRKQKAVEDIKEILHPFLPTDQDAIIRYLGNKFLDPLKSAYIEFCTRELSNIEKNKSRFI